MNKIAVFLVVLAIASVGMGCGGDLGKAVEPENEKTTPISPLVLRIGADEKGTPITSTPDGRVYTMQELQKAIEVAAKEGGPLDVSIAEPIPAMLKEQPQLRVASKPPRNPNMRRYIEDITPVNDPGVVVLMTKEGVYWSRIWRRAGEYASYVMFEYNLHYPVAVLYPELYGILRQQVQTELFYHAVAYAFWPSRRFREVNINFLNLP